MKQPLRMHIENVHFNIKNFECEGCQRKFYKEKSFKRHQNERLCQFCDFSSKCFQLHINHQASHEFDCYECDCPFDKGGLAKKHGHNRSIAKCSASSEQRKSHLAKSRAVQKCYFCDDAEIDYD